MDAHQYAIGTQHRWIAATVVAALWLGIAAHPSFAGDAPADAATAASGMVIHLDPQTGQLLKEPMPGSVPLQLDPSLQRGLSTSHQGLLEVPGSVPGGGVKVDLQGRFRSPLIGATGADGTVRIHHLREAAESADGHDRALAADGAPPAGAPSLGDPSTIRPR